MKACKLVVRAGSVYETNRRDANVLFSGSAAECKQFILAAYAAEGTKVEVPAAKSEVPAAVKAFDSSEALRMLEALRDERKNSAAWTQAFNRLAKVLAG